MFWWHKILPYSRVLNRKPHLGSTSWPPLVYTKSLCCWHWHITQTYFFDHTVLSSAQTKIPSLNSRSLMCSNNRKAERRNHWDPPELIPWSVDKKPGTNTLEIDLSLRKSPIHVQKLTEMNRVGDQHLICRWAFHSWKKHVFLLTLWIAFLFKIFQTICSWIDVFQKQWNITDKSKIPSRAASHKKVVKTPATSEGKQNKKLPRAFRTTINLRFLNNVTNEN